MEIKQFRLELQCEDPEERLYKSPAKGALMHGVLMQAAGTDALHSGTNSVRPYTQYLESIGDGRYQWTINLLDSEFCSSIIEWLEIVHGRLLIEHYALELDVLSVEQTLSVSYSDLMTEKLSEFPPKFLSLHLKTPTAFKRAGSGNYCLWPEPRLIVQSALNKWNNFSDGAKFDDPDLLDEIVQKIHVQSFELRSRNVAMDGTSFAGTVGHLSFYLHKDSIVRQLFNLVCTYAQFSGLGIKTAMGLGACQASLLPMNRKISSKSIQKV